MVLCPPPGVGRGGRWKGRTLCGLLYPHNGHRKIHPGVDLGIRKSWFFLFVQPLCLNRSRAGGRAEVQLTRGKNPRPKNKNDRIFHYFPDLNFGFRDREKWKERKEESKSYYFVSVGTKSFRERIIGPWGSGSSVKRARAPLIFSLAVIPPFPFSIRPLQHHPSTVYRSVESCGG